jgi:GDPmannose 4,6-dehydratase
MWLMLQQERPEDFVVGTGEVRTVREFVQAAFAHVNLDWRDYVVTDPRYYRPTEVAHLLADASKAKSKLGWVPRVTFEELVRIMVEHDLRALRGDVPEGRTKAVKSLAA